MEQEVAYHYHGPSRPSYQSSQKDLAGTIRFEAIRCDNGPMRKS